MIKDDFIFIAEIGINHNGSLEKALNMIEAAHGSGAHAVKFQTMVPEEMYSKYTTSLLKEGSEKSVDMSQINFFRQFSLCRNDYAVLKNRAESCGMVFFSSPFDIQSVEILESIGVTMYKIASSEVTNHPLLKKIAETRKPVIMSTGISTGEEIAMAVELLSGGGTPEIILLHCVSLYPLPPDKANLSRICALERRFKCETGFSDHSKGADAAGIAAVLGARVFEKHFMLSGDKDCPDREVSLDPGEFRGFISSVKKAALICGDGHLDFDFSEKEIANSARRSLFSRRFIPRGKKLEADDISIKRPGIGIPAYRINELLGRETVRDVPEDYILKPDYFR